MIENNPTLTIATDLDDFRWLEYILEEFRRINRLQASVRIVSVGEGELREEGAVFYYTKSGQRSPGIVNLAGEAPSGHVEYVSEGLFVIPGTTTQEEGFDLGYDLFWNAFVFLSRLEEYQARRRIDGYAVKHPRKDKKTFLIPVVNKLFDQLESILREHFPHLLFDAKEAPVLELAHDVDYIKKTGPLLLKQTAFNIFNVFKSLAHPHRITDAISQAGRFLFSKSSYWCFDYWEDLEKKYKQRSTFYFFAKTNKTKQSWLYDPSYDIRSDSKVSEKIKALINEGFEVGLHGSFYSARHENLLATEKGVLEKVAGGTISKNRQHWLQYDEDLTPYFHEELFDYDTSLGFNDKLGFRSGICSQYHPFDHKEQKAFAFLETPPIVMDATCYDYGAGESEILLIQALELVKELKKYKKAHVMISWHQRVCHPDYDWQEGYEKILEQYYEYL